MHEKKMVVYYSSVYGNLKLIYMFIWTICFGNVFKACLKFEKRLNHLI